MTEQTARDMLELYRANRTPKNEMALIDFLDLTEQERWEVMFFTMTEMAHKLKDYRMVLLELLNK